MRLRMTLLAALALALPAAAQQPSFGPLTFEEGAPLQRISYTAMTEGADLTAVGTFTTDVYLGFSNIFEQDSSATHVLFMDMERLISAVTLRWGVVERLEIGGRATLETTGGGRLDSFVLRWHERLGFGQANRDRFPENQYAQRLTDGGGTVFLDVPSQALGLEDVRLFAKWRAAASADARSVLSLRAVTRLPAGSNLAGDERSDFAVMAIARLGVGAWYVHGLLGASTVRAPAQLQPVTRGSSRFLTVAVERSLGASIAAIAQLQAQTPVLQSFEHRELDRSSTNLVIGLAGRLGRTWRWDASFQEDVPADTPAIDFTLGLRVSRSW